MNDPLLPFEILYDHGSVRQRIMTCSLRAVSTIIVDFVSAFGIADGQ
jgi:hypothetical protein